MSAASLRIARTTDAVALACLVNGAYRPGAAGHGWTHESELVLGERTNPTQIIEAITKAGSVILLRCVEARIEACVHVEKDGVASRIGMLAVSPAAQGAGVGKEMLAWAERYAIENFGAEKFLMLVISARSELVSFYLRRGYQKTGVILDYPQAAGVGTPKVGGLKIEALEKPAPRRARDATTEHKII